ncbi:MAG TPA: SIMPL domain-containing protein [Candidatus Egerieousia sp.]|nr:SIMPL domain-containing protein [Candidatus Egerieousia sp.]HPT05848.1 SIMPL domain-containing protein [Candidatus Egerieousia sp.]
MKRIYMISLAAAAACTALLASGTKSCAQENSKQNYVEVQTRCEREITPDEIYMSITINEKDSKGKITVEQQEKKMISALKGVGIDVEKNLTVDDINSDLQKYFLRKSTISASKSYTLKVKDAADLGKALQTLNDAGISDVNLQKAQVSQTLQEKTKNELYAEVAKKSKENATTMIETVGGKVGKVIYAQTYNSYQRAYSNIALMSKAMAVDNAEPEEETTLQMDKTTVSVTATFRFAIE